MRFGMKNKVLYVVMIIAVLLGIVMIKVKGFNYGTLYSNHQRIEVVIGKEYNLDDISKIAKETINSDAVTRKTTLFGTSVSIDAKDITDDKINNLFTKLNEKYGKNYNIKDIKKDKILTELNATSVSSMDDDEIVTLIAQIKEKYGLDYSKEELQSTSSLVRMYNVSEIKMYDLVKDFVKPFALSLAIVMVYCAIRFHKLYKSAWILMPLKLAFEMILNQAFLIAVIAITRIPVSQFVVSLLIFVWLLQLVSETVKAEAKLKEVNILKESK